MMAQIVFYFLGGVLLASPWGVGSYFLLHWLRRIKPSQFVVVDYLLALLGAIFFNFTLIVIVPLCLGAAYATRATEGRDKASFYDFVRALSATALPSLLLLLIEIVFIYPLALPVSVFLSTRFAGVPQQAVISLVIGTYLGLLTSPSLVPIALWIKKSSKLRPGIDRLLVEGESMPPEAH